MPGVKVINPTKNSLNQSNPNPSSSNVNVDLIKKNIPENNRKKDYSKITKQIIFQGFF